MRYISSKLLLLLLLLLLLFYELPVVQPEKTKVCVFGLAQVL